VTEPATTAISAPGVLRSSYHVAWTLAVLAGLSHLAGHAKADPPPPKQVDQAPSIQTQREAIERRVGTFVANSIREPSDVSLARWNEPLCPLALGLPPAEGEFVHARLSEIAAAAGAPLARQPCRGNLVVIVSAQPDAVLKAWYARDHRIFGDATPHRIDELLKTPRTVRIWYNTNSESASALPYATGVRGLVMTGVSNLAVDSTAEDSHIGFNAVRTFSSVIVAVDGSRTQGINLSQLADYAAMVGLAEIQLDADVGTLPTILRLFSGSDEAKPTGLSVWDTAFLNALYHTSQKTNRQRSAIAQSMVHDVAP
jgi:hypothetical protein